MENWIDRYFEVQTIRYSNEALEKKHQGNLLWKIKCWHRNANIKSYLAHQGTVFICIVPRLHVCGRNITKKREKILLGYICKINKNVKSLDSIVRSHKKSPGVMDKIQNQKVKK